MTDYRAVFDARVSFANEGGLTAQGFRLDVAGPDVSSAQITEAFIRHLGLAMVASVEISSLTIVEEAHRGSRDAVPAASPAGRRYVDLSHTIRDGLVTLPGIPGPRISAHLSREESRAVYAAGTEFEIARIDMVANTGTYLDTAYHRYAEGSDLAALPLAAVVDLPAAVFHLSDAADRGITATLLADRDLRGAAVLLHTGWDRFFDTEKYSGDAPFLTEGGAQYLVDQGVALVGIDSINIDDMTSASAGERPAHSLLLAAGIPIVEHLTGLDALPARGARFTAVPPRVERFGTFPVRAFATLD